MMMADDGGSGEAGRPDKGVKASQDTRQRTIDALCEHFASDTLDLNEFEKRIDLAHQAETVAELRGLLSDLATPTTAVVPSTEATPAVVERATLPLDRVARPELVRDNQFVVGLWGGPSRKGSWIPARHVWSFALMGGVELDLRQARLGPGVTEISVFAMWGGVEIIVPPDLQIEFSGMGIMGAFDCADDVGRVYDPDAPIVKINGLAIMGGAEVTVREQGETAREAKKRKKLARNERRRLKRGS